MIALEQFATESNGNEGASKDRGFATKVGHGTFVLAVKFTIRVLDHLEHLNRAVQSTSSSVSDAIKAMQLTSDALRQLRNDTVFDEMYADTVEVCTDLDIPMPCAPRSRRPPQRYTGPANVHEWDSANEYFRSQFFLFLDQAIGQLQHRYEQPGLHQYAELEQCLLTERDKKQVAEIVKNYPELNAQRLTVQLTMLRQQGCAAITIKETVHKLVSMPSLLELCLIKLKLWFAYY